MPSERVTVERWKHTCTRCGHSWLSDIEAPIKCTGCKTFLWDRERQRDPSKVNVGGRPRGGGGS